MELLEVWGDGKNVVIKYRREGFGNIWYAASPHWPRENSPNDKTLIKQGYHKLDMRELGQLGV